MNFISHFVEPSRLLLVWQSPDLGGDRLRRIVGELRKQADDSVMLRYFQDSDDFREAAKLGFAGYPAFPISEREHRSNVLETFVRRLPPSSRSDYRKYLELLGIRHDARISSFALLGYSGASLPSDEFSIVNPFDDAPSPCEFLTEVAGARHYWSNSNPLAAGDRVEFAPEPDNQFDSNAIRILVNERTIGYVNRAQAPAFHRWLAHEDVEATIDRVNGSSERPRVMLFVRVHQKRRVAA